MLYALAFSHHNAERQGDRLTQEIRDHSSKTLLLATMAETVQQRITLLDTWDGQSSAAELDRSRAAFGEQVDTYRDARSALSRLSLSDATQRLLVPIDEAETELDLPVARVLAALSDYGTDEKALATAIQACRTAHLALLRHLHVGLRLLEEDTGTFGIHPGSEQQVFPLALGAMALVLAIATAAMVVVNTGTQARRLAYAADHDALTGLTNRGAFETALDSQLAHCQLTAGSHALLVIGIDRFKIVNETFGHAGGDRLLHEVAALLTTEATRDDLLCRLGGDEFGLLMRSVPPELAEARAERLRTAIAAYVFERDGRRMPVAASIGMVTFGDQHVSAKDLLRNAMACCLSAKDEGRNRVHLATTQGAQIRRRRGDRQWLNRIQASLQRDRFVLHGQLIHPLRDDVDDGRTTFEVLLRLEDETGLGLIPPQQFLPTAERYHVINDIDRWVVRNSLEWLVDQDTAANSLRININICGLTASDPQFHRYVRSLIKDTGVPPESLCFEITESMAINNLSHAASLVSGLGDLGCQFALDDFGSGLSSFSQLRHLAVDYLKIDGGFVYNIERDTVNRAMVESINSLGHRLGKRTVAEFVANDQIRRIMAEIGVDYVQGFAMHRPEPLTDIGARLRQTVDGQTDPRNIFVA